MEQNMVYTIVLGITLVCLAIVVICRRWHRCRHRSRHRSASVGSYETYAASRFGMSAAGSVRRVPQARVYDGVEEDTDAVVCDGETTYGAPNRDGMVLMVDVETTGLALNSEVPCTECPENWPRMVRLSWLVVDGSGTIVHDGDMIVCPRGFIIPEEVVDIHGIDTATALREGVELSEALEALAADAKGCVRLVGHNIWFDRNVIGAECRRLGLSDMLDGMPMVCTMKLSTAFCAIPHPVYVYKWPRLSELYYILFGHELENAHNGAADVRAVHDCYVQLKKLKVI